VAKKKAKKKLSKPSRSSKDANLTRPLERLAELAAEIQRIDADIAELDLKDNELEAKDLASAKPFLLRASVTAEVNVVFPWST